VGEIQSSTVVNFSQETTMHFFQQAELNIVSFAFGNHSEISCVKEEKVVTYSEWGKVTEKSAAKGGIQIGQSFGKLGQVVKHPGLKITDWGKHGTIQATARGVSQEVMLRTVNNASVVLRQSSGNYLFLTKDAAVVLNSTGRVVTNYPAAKFDMEILKIIQIIP